MSCMISEIDVSMASVGFLVGKRMKLISKRTSEEPNARSLISETNNQSQIPPPNPQPNQEIKMPEYTADKRILLVDDEPFNLKSHQMLFQMAGKELGFPMELFKTLIDTAKDGLEAQQRVREAFLQNGEQYALIFSDCQMPRCDGYDATVAIRDFVSLRGLQQPVIIACTGNVEGAQIEKAFECFFDEVVAKPVNVATIKTILQEVVRII